MSRDLERDLRRLEEHAYTLAGDRGMPLEAAVRRGDIEILESFSAPTSAGANPTQAEFDALREEVLRLHTLLANAASRR